MKLPKCPKCCRKVLKYDYVKKYYCCVTGARDKIDGCGYIYNPNKSEGIPFQKAGDL